MTQVPELMTVAEVAEVFRTTDESVHRWCRLGRLPYIALPSGTKRFRRQDVEAFLAVIKGPVKGLDPDAEPVSASAQKGQS